MTGAEPIRPDDRDARALRPRSATGVGGQHALAPLRRVLAGDDRDDLVRAREERAAGWDGGGGAPGEDDPKGGHPSILPCRTALSPPRRAPGRRSARAAAAAGAAPGGAPGNRLARRRRPAARSRRAPRAATAAPVRVVEAQDRARAAVRRCARRRSRPRPAAPHAPRRRRPGAPSRVATRTAGGKPQRTTVGELGAGVVRPGCRWRGPSPSAPPTPTSTTGASSAARAAASDHQRRQSSPTRRLSRATIRSPSSSSTAR